MHSEIRERNRGLVRGFWAASQIDADVARLITLGNDGGTCQGEVYVWRL